VVVELARMALTSPPAAASGKLPDEPQRSSSISAVAWTPNAELDYHRWVLEGRRIGAIGRGSPWWVGDWLLYGTAKWGERYVEAVKITRYDAKSLRNLRYVASRFDSSLRRENLTWSHHALLAACDQDEQRHWLDRAAAERLSVEDLRIELRSAQRGDYVAGPQDPVGEIQQQSAAIVCPNCGHELGGS
jgi:hypothetical protein